MNPARSGASPDWRSSVEPAGLPSRPAAAKAFCHGVGELFPPMNSCGQHTQTTRRMKAPVFAAWRLLQRGSEVFAGLGLVAALFLHVRERSQQQLNLVQILFLKTRHLAHPRADDHTVLVPTECPFVT